ncbi:MAG: hypothetical protein ACR2KG_13375 [Nocardioidaceae bacterium]
MMAQLRGQAGRPVDLLAALPTPLRTFDANDWSEPDDPDGWDGEDVARSRWRDARSAYASARWGISRLDWLIAESRADRSARGLDHG